MSMVATLISHLVAAASTPWTRVGPWNIFDDKDIRGEAGTLATAASPQDKPDTIYAGGQNNGVSSGVLKTVDGGGGGDGGGVLWLEPISSV